MTLRSSLQNGICKILFHLVQTENLLLDSTLGNKMIYSHILLLSDTVGAVCGLSFYGRVPPRIQMDDIVSACQVQPQTTSLETDKENRTRKFDTLKSQKS